jgi:ferredoxin
MVSPIQFYDYIAAEEGQVNVPTYRQSLAAPDTKTYWVEQAACETLPPEIFEPVFDLGSRQKNIEVSEDRYEQARKACSDCPVFHMCYTHATESDFYYTTRAGLRPGQLDEYLDKGMVINITRTKSDKCPRGHYNWKTWGKKQPRRKCVDCSNMGTAGRREWDEMNGRL